MEADTTEEHLRRPIWLVGHSYPTRWKDKLVGPLDPRHPTRHAIWTSVLDSAQQRLFMDGPRRRLDVTKCYMFNAVAKDSTEDPVDWHGTAIGDRVVRLRGLIGTYHPRMLLTFGADVFGFVSEAVGSKPPSRTRLLGISEIGEAFRSAVSGFTPDGTNVLPLLHAVVARAKWATIAAEFNPQFSDTNYFDYSGAELAKVLLKHFKEVPVWCEPQTD